MKFFNKKIKTAALGALFASALLAGCEKDFFEVEDPNGIDSEIWNNAGAIDLLLNRAYDLSMPTWPVPGSIHYTSDEHNSSNATFLYGNLVENSVTDIGTSNSITGNRYFTIRRCNQAIEEIDAQSNLPKEVTDPLKGQFYFIRAYTYLNLVRLYGGVPLILKAQDLTGEDLNVPRSKSSECFAAIARDLDSAASLLPARWTGANIGRISRATAMAMKGRALLYWASAQFNPGHDDARWANAYAANKAAYDMALADGYSLFPNYANIFVTEDHNEVMMVRKHDAVSVSPGRGTNNEYVTRPPSESNNGGGQNQPTWNLVKAYFTREGLPITHSASNYDEVMFWQNRDPRLEASIAYNGATWALSSKAGRKQWSYTGVLDEQAAKIVTGFYSKKTTNATLAASQAQYNSNTGGGSGMDWIELRFAEVILNLAECANETGKIDEAKEMVKLIRKRAGITEGSFDYGVAIATNMLEMRDLILQERQVEFALEGMRYWDLRRTRNLHLLNARESLKNIPKPPYYAGTGTVAGRIYLDKPDALGIRPRDTANLNNKVTYTAMFTTAIASIEGSNVVTIPENYYFYALPNFFSQSSYVIAQTKGWAGGTFDPLQ